jgi:hypothetical protein
MDREQRDQNAPAAGDGSVAGGDSAANNDRPPNSGQMRTERAKVPARERFRRWSLDHKLAVLGIVLSFIAAIAAPVIPLLLTSDGNGGSSGTDHGQFQINGNNNGQVGGIINNYGSTASSDPQAQIVQRTGSWSVQGFHDAIGNRETSIVALYLESGMKATTLYKDASAILFGFQGASTQNGDPVALVKTFQAGGFKVDDELRDSYLMGALTNNLFPLMFETDQAPKGYTGGYAGGTFVGSLLFWIVQRAAAAGPTDQDTQVIKYLVSQGANCKVPLSFLKYNGPTVLAGTSPYEELLPLMQSCAK